MTRLPHLTRPLAAGLAAALALAVAAPAVAQSEGQPDVQSSADAKPQTKGEKRLAKLLEGRVAGEPTDCIRTLPNMQMETIDKTAYVYGRGNTIYVQRTRDPENIDDREALVQRQFLSGQLCRLDIVNTFDPVFGMVTGPVFFEEFVPYTRVKDDTNEQG
ncbi:MAG: hypothetical protein GC147_08185 [Porphyrobacter sp.]|nr:hypothetical protein [Porphyrobacter sp.]